MITIIPIDGHEITDDFLSQCNNGTHLCAGGNVSNPNLFFQKNCKPSMKPSESGCSIMIYALDKDDKSKQIEWNVFFMGDTEGQVARRCFAVSRNFTGDPGESVIWYCFTNHGIYNEIDGIRIQNPDKSDSLYYPMDEKIGSYGYQYFGFWSYTVLDYKGLRIDVKHDLLHLRYQERRFGPDDKKKKKELVTMEARVLFAVGIEPTAGPMTPTSEWEETEISPLILGAIIGVTIIVFALLVTLIVMCCLRKDPVVVTQRPKSRV